MRIWASLFRANSSTFNSVVVADAGKAFESFVAAVPASAAVHPSSSLHLGTVAGFASADLSAQLLSCFIFLLFLLQFHFLLPEFLLILKFFF